jgi:hypothetical protein
MPVRQCAQPARGFNAPVVMAAVMAFGPEAYRTESYGQGPWAEEIRAIPGEV